MDVMDLAREKSNSKKRFEMEIFFELTLTILSLIQNHHLDQQALVLAPLLSILLPTNWTELKQSNGEWLYLHQSGRQLLPTH